jgi:DNA-binding transcriptional MerR regulator
MEMRVEQLSVRSGVSVDTIRYYQSKALLEPPRRQGRVAWYDEDHLERLARIRSLQHRGFTLATIVRLVTGELDAADEALLAELSGVHQAPAPDGPPSSEGGSSTELEAGFTIAELAEETGVPLALLKAIEAEGLLIPSRMGDVERYTSEDVAASKAGLLLLDWGIPLSALLELARRHNEATQAVAREAVAMFSTYVRGPLRHGRQVGPPPDGSTGSREEDGIDRLLQAYAELLPAVNDLVGHHFTRTLVRAALDHVDQVGSEAERSAIWDQVGAEGAADLAGQDEQTTAPA